MKKLASLLAFYVFTLVLMPCFDNEYHQDEAAAATEHIFDGSHSELCSPFCSDHECHTHITLSLVNSFFTPEQYGEATPVEIVTEVATPFFAIWQPPKIS